MYKLSIHIDKVDIERRIEIIDKLNDIRYLLDNYFKFRNLEHDTVDFRLEKAYGIYKKTYKEELNLEEQTILYLYTLFPSDITFLGALKANNNDVNKLASLRLVHPSFIKLRFICLKDMKAYKEGKKLELKNNN